MRNARRIRLLSRLAWRVRPPFVVRVLWAAVVCVVVIPAALLVALTCALFPMGTRRPECPPNKKD